MTNLSKIHDELFYPFEQEFNNFFNGFFQPRTKDVLKGTAGYPKINITQDNTYWCIQATVPGVVSKDLKVEFTQGKGSRNQKDYCASSVRISGEIAEEYRSPVYAEVFVREISKQRFSREVGVPDYAEGEPEAELKDGFLTLKWKHYLGEKTAKSKVIEIKTN